MEGWCASILFTCILSVQVIITVIGWNTGWREDTTTTTIWTRRRAPGWSRRTFYKTTPSSTRRTSRWVPLPVQHWWRSCSVMEKVFVFPDYRPYSVCWNHSGSYWHWVFRVAKMFITLCKCAVQKERTGSVALKTPTARTPTPVPNIPNPDICDQVSLK